jgi:hypothetical protein
VTQPPFSVWTSRSVEGGSGRHRESAARLAVEQGRVQNSTGVVQGHILIGPNRASVAVDFDPAEIKDEAVGSQLQRAVKGGIGGQFLESIR